MKEILHAKANCSSRSRCALLNSMGKYIVGSTQDLFGELGYHLDTRVRYVVVVYPLPWPLLVGGVRCSSLGGPPASFSVHLASSTVTPAGSVHKSQGDNVVHMWVCRVCGCYRSWHSGDGCPCPSSFAATIWNSTSTTMTQIITMIQAVNSGSQHPRWMM